MKKIIASAIVAVAASPVWASGPGEKHFDGEAFLADGAFTYEIFEKSVPHVDLDGCPAQFDTDAVFCRMTLANDTANVFVFAREGDQVLLAVKSYELGDGFLPF